MENSHENLTDYHFLIDSVIIQQAFVTLHLNIGASNHCWIQLAFQVMHNTLKLYVDTRGHQFMGI